MIDLTQYGWSADEVQLIRQTVAKEAPDAEVAKFLYTAKRSGLDPLAGQILLVPRSAKGKTNWTTQTSIDGYRLIADRTGKYAGNDDPTYDSENAPTKAFVSVWKVVDGLRCPFTASARWDQYYPGDGPQGFFWRKMPHLMLGKVAEALALRKAFPADLSGIYTAEEMEQADRQETPARMMPRTVVDGTVVAKATDAPEASQEASEGEGEPLESRGEERVSHALLNPFLMWLQTNHIPIAKVLLWARQNIRPVSRLEDLTNAEFNRLQIEIRRPAHDPASAAQ